MNAGEVTNHVKDPARLAALRAVAMLDTPTEEPFDRLSGLAARFVNAPVALVTLVDADRVFLKSCIGLPEPWCTQRETPLSHSFCPYNRIPGEPLVIEDARTHPLVRDSPAIREMQAIAYLGIPLVNSDGHVLGSFCVIDVRPRRWQQDEIAVIKHLAAAVMTEIQLRLEIVARKQAEEQFKTFKDDLERRIEQQARELEETQFQFMHAEKLSTIGKLSASIAHEVNNPLQGIMTILQGFKNKLVLEEEDKDMLNLALGESYRMKSLIRSLQNFYRPSSGKKNFMDIHASIDSVLLLCKSHFKRRKISTVLNYADMLPQVLAVPDQIKQVLFNLLNNAADALPKGGEITITTWQEDRRIAVAIKDTGIGIDPDEIEHIFEPFYTTKPGKKGTGLGLSVSHRIIKNHHGEILVESRPLEGAVFTVVLPIEEGEGGSSK